MRSSFALLAAGSLAITALGRLVDFESAPEANMANGGTLTAEPLGGGNPDVVVWDLQSYANYGPAGGYHAYALGTTSCNQGDVPLLWQSSTNLHPVIGQNMYRWKDGRFEQIGMGWLKHGFFALSSRTADHAKPPAATRWALTAPIPTPRAATVLKAVSVPSTR